MSSRHSPPPVPSLCMQCLQTGLDLRYAVAQAEMLEARCVDLLTDFGVVPPALLSQTAFAALRFQVAREEVFTHQVFGHRET